MNIVFYTFIHYVYEQGLVYKCVLLRHITKYLGPLVWESIKPEMERFEKARPRWAHMWSVLITQLRNQPLHRTVSPHSSNMAMKRPRNSGQESRLYRSRHYKSSWKIWFRRYIFWKNGYKTPQNKNFAKKIHRRHKVTYWYDLVPFLIWVMGGASRPPSPPHNSNKTSRPTRGG